MTPLLLWNVRGLMAKQGLKLAELQAVMMKEQAELVVLTETHLDEAFTDEQISASGYQTLRVDREPHPRKQKLRQRGGVLVFAHESRTLSKITTRQGSDFELLAFDDDRSGKRYIAIYRRPGPSVSWDLLDALDEELQQADHPVVLGDLNMNTLAQAPQPRQLHTLLKHKYSLQQRIPFVTRPPTRPNGRGSQIDHIWAKHPCRCSHIPQLSQHSDHRAVRMYCASLQPSPQKRAKVVWRRRWDKVEGDDVRAILEQVMPRARLWSHMPEEAAEEMRRNMCGPGEPKLHRTQPSEVKGVVDRWDEAWTRVKTELAPKQRVRVKTTTSKFPWITKEVRAAMRERNQLQRRSTAQGATAQDRAEYQTARADTERQYKRARREYITKHWKKCSTGKGFNKEHWRFLNRVMGRKASIRPEPKCSPDALNESFLAKVERIRAPLESEPQPAVTELSAAGRLSEFRKVTADEVLCVLGRIRVTNAVSVEGWPPQWKKAEVIPLWKKKGSRSDPGVYRPIALLPAISRVVEKMLSIQIKDHIREVGALPAFQHGYQPGRSCETAVAQLVDLVASARDKGDIVLVASADCSAAFDTVSHDILLRKLERACGIQGKALELMHSYLGGRRQRVRMSGDRTSQWRHTSWGVPQGSVWGPLIPAARKLARPPACQQPASSLSVALPTSSQPAACQQPACIPELLPQRLSLGEALGSAQGKGWERSSETRCTKAGRGAREEDLGNSLGEGWERISGTRRATAGGGARKRARRMLGEELRNALGKAWERNPEMRWAKAGSSARHWAKAGRGTQKRAGQSLGEGARGRAGRWLGEELGWERSSETRM
eukprot:gene58235-biopygen109576